MRLPAGAMWHTAAMKSLEVRSLCRVLAAILLAACAAFGQSDDGTIDHVRILTKSLGARAQGFETDHGRIVLLQANKKGGPASQFVREREGLRGATLEVEDLSKAHALIEKSIGSTSSGIGRALREKISRPAQVCVRNMVGDVAEIVRPIGCRKRCSHGC